jgi:hypothetical protein
LEKINKYVKKQRNFKFLLFFLFIFFANIAVLWYNIVVEIWLLIICACFAQNGENYVFFTIPKIF